jgi:hypothetical protein
MSPLPISGPNASDPAGMTVEQRLAEVAALLAAGLRRLRGRQQANNPSDFSSLPENSVDFGRRQSVDGTASTTLENTHAG